MTIDYNFHQKTGDGEKYFNKTAPQELNAQTLPPEFNVAAGHQLPGSLCAARRASRRATTGSRSRSPTRSSGKTLTQNANFTGRVA